MEAAPAKIISDEEKTAALDIILRLVQEHHLEQQYIRERDKTTITLAQIIETCNGNPEIFRAAYLEYLEQLER
jgi:hypothetical protein